MVSAQRSSNGECAEIVLKWTHFNIHSYSIFYVSILSLRLGLAATASHAVSKSQYRASQYRVAWNGLITNGSLSG